MLRSTTTAFALALALALTGCGKSTPTAASSSSRLSAVASTPIAPVAQGYDPNAVSTGTTTGATGTFTLALSSLKADKLAFIEVSLSGSGLASPVTKRLSAADLASSNTLAFEHIPVGSLQASLTMLDAGGNALGAKATSVQVQANQETKLQLKLAASPTFGFDIVDPKAVATTTPIDPATNLGNTLTESPVSRTPVSEEDNAALAVEITNKEVVRKFLLFKKLSVTVKVTNQNKSATLNGQVTVDFHKVTGIFTKSDSVVETLTAPVQGLAPGKSVEITLQSTKAAEDAEATVHTVLASSTASTRE
ncbi:MAG: hypothetical protein JWM80_1753 [Cyanobacteria bacterium RYN_339]|nr:hypothetical protein [Cyanobacteria bacterium RYN_339]